MQYNYKKTLCIKINLFYNLISIMENFFISNSTEKLFISFKDGKGPQSVIVFHNPKEDPLVFSKYLAKYIQCENKKNLAPCFSCKSCQKIEKNIHPDVIYPEKTGITKSYSVATIREIKLNSYVLPNESTFKIYVFLDAQNLSISAQNALLKILEDTPKHDIFLFFCNNLSKILNTVKSRSQVFETCFSSNSETNNDEVKSFFNQALKIIVSRDECDFLAFLSKLNKDKGLFKSMLFFLATEIDKAMNQKLQLEKGISENSGVLLKVFSLDELSYFASVLDKANDMLEKNVNFNLLLTYFAASLFD